MRQGTKVLHAPSYQVTRLINTASWHAKLGAGQTEVYEAARGLDGLDSSRSGGQAVAGIRFRVGVAWKQQNGRRVRS
jgi:hypothetical protein